jgi:hypothetical protein
VKIENHCDEADRQDKAGGDSDTKLVPDRKKGDLLTPTFTVTVAAVKVVR